MSCGEMLADGFTQIGLGLPRVGKPLEARHWTVFVVAATVQLCEKVKIIAGNVEIVDRDSAIGGALRVVSIFCGIADLKFEKQLDGFSR